MTSSNNPRWPLRAGDFWATAEAVVDLLEAHPGFEEIDVTARDSSDVVQVVQFYDMSAGKYARISIEEVPETEEEY